MDQIDIHQAAEFAHSRLLFGLVPLDLVFDSAERLAKGPVHFSVHDLAVASALVFFINGAFGVLLKPVQVLARNQTVGWAREGVVAPSILRVFETTLYDRYRDVRAFDPEPQAERPRRAECGQRRPERASHPNMASSSVTSSKLV